MTLRPPGCRASRSADAVRVYSELRRCIDACRASEAPVAYGGVTPRDHRPPRPMAVSGPMKT
jgi:hypothetical protein